MKTLIIGLFFMLVSFHPTYSCETKNTSTVNFEILDQGCISFFDNSQNILPNFYVFLIEEDSDLNSKVKKRFASERTSFYDSSIIACNFQNVFYKIDHFQHSPSINFISLRVLKL